MSAPVSRFSKLTLSQDMQSSRSHARGPSGGKGKGKAPMGEVGSSSLSQILNDDSDDDDLDEEGHLGEEEPEEEGPDEGLDEEGPDEGTRIGPVFAFDHCRLVEEPGVPAGEPGALYAFQLAYAEVERICIRIRRTGENCSLASCRGGGTCHHIMWLQEQLSHALPDIPGLAAATPYEKISTIGLGNVCEELHCELREGPDSDTEDDAWQLKKVRSASAARQTRGTIRERMNVVRDIMATLSAPQITDDYRNDIFETPGNVLQELALGDLEATMSRLLIRNDDLFYRFKTLVPQNLRAREYFRKALLKAEATCQSLEKFCELGPEVGPFDLVWCADTLIDIVNSISINVAERQPLSPASEQEAARALVDILNMVVRRNVDVYQNLSWVRKRAHAEPQIDRNLYERLIRKPPQNYPSLFVLNTLQGLSEARPFVRDLQGILRLLEQVGWGAPVEYRNKLQEIIAQLKGSSPDSPDFPPESGPSTSSGKRPADPADRKAKKRMK